LNRNLYKSVFLLIVMFANRGERRSLSMINKKGLSDVVTTVLIILLALAAVIIIWSFVRPAIQTAGKGVTTGTECFKTDIEVISCDEGDNKIVVKNNGQKAEKVKVVYTTSAGVATTEDIPSLASFNQQNVLEGDFNPVVAITAGDKVSASAVLVADDGTETVCAPSQQPVTCVA